MEINMILQCAIDGCKNLNDRILSAQQQAGLEPTGVRKFLNERLFQHETAYEIIKQMKFDVDVDVTIDLPNSNYSKNVDFILKKNDETHFIGECKVWKSQTGEPEFKKNVSIMYDLTMLELIDTTKTFYLIYTVHTINDRQSNIKFIADRLRAENKKYQIYHKAFQIYPMKDELFEVIYLNRCKTFREAEIFTI